MKQDIPAVVKEVVKELQEAGYEAYAVGGCVRDIFLGKKPTDWDVTTNATPVDIQKVFPHSFYENEFFTVTVLTESEDPTLKAIEITTFRADVRYGDRRHPEEVAFAETLEQDLQRRDFTVNAMALRFAGPEPELVDPLGGANDLREKVIRAVGEPEKRFQEDALRMMRAVRFTSQLGFTIEGATKKAIRENSNLLSAISKERVRDELGKILFTQQAAEGIELLSELGLLAFIAPELEEGRGVTQNKHHSFTVWEHGIRSLQYAAQENWNMDVRLASLLHDIGKPRAKHGEGPDATFYSHEVVGANMTRELLNRLRFPKKQAEKVAKLVRYHMFFYDVGQVTESSVRRLLLKVGKEDMEDLIRLRMADRIGSGVPKAEPYRLRHFEYILEKVSQDPLSAKMLQVDGTEIMKLAGIEPGPRVGHILEVLLGEALEDPKRNERSLLEKRVKELAELPEQELAALVEKAKEERDKIEMKRDEMTKEKYWVT
ncbi:HD domain-containing protein [Patescibacteria group bacterium]|nr:HD domain-containing protein [Patescibacteria group bacterium]